MTDTVSSAGPSTLSAMAPIGSSMICSARKSPRYSQIKNVTPPIVSAKIIAHWKTRCALLYCRLLILDDTAFDTASGRL